MNPPNFLILYKSKLYFQFRKHRKSIIHLYIEDNSKTEFIITFTISYHPFYVIPDLIQYFFLGFKCLLKLLHLFVWLRNVQEKH